MCWTLPSSWSTMYDGYSLDIPRKCIAALTDSIILRSKAKAFLLLMKSNSYEMDKNG